MLAEKGKCRSVVAGTSDLTTEITEITEKEMQSITSSCKVLVDNGLGAYLSKSHTSFLLSVTSVFSVVRLGGAATFHLTFSANIKL